jgi:crossover junction endodeoxyribonuclease RuvC
MKILGIDPGTLVTGYGIIDADGDEITLIDYGTVTPLKNEDIGRRLHHLYNSVLDIIRRYRPEVVAVEQPFISKNVRSAMAIGRAQAIALLAAAAEGIKAYEYTPTEVKQRVADYGASSKEQIQEMVRLQLGLAEVPRPDDAADAIAVAICHLREVHVSNLLASQQ